MPRNSAFKKANKAIAKTHDFFSYESPYPIVAPASEVCCGPCCAQRSKGTAPSSASTEASAVATNRSAPVDKMDVVEPGNAPEMSLLDIVSTLQESGADESASDENEESGEDEVDERYHKDTVAGDDNTTNDLCGCKTCLAAGLAGMMHKCDPQEVAAWAAARKAKDEQDRDAAKKLPARANKKKRKAQNQRQAETAEAENDDVAATVVKLGEQVLIVEDLEAVVQWAREKIVKVTLPLGERARQQAMATLIASAKAGSMKRLMDDVAKVKVVQGATVRDQVEADVTVPLKKLAEKHILRLQAAIAGANAPEKSTHEMLKGSKGQEKKILDIITKTPMTDEEYEEVSSRSLVLHSVLLDFSKNDVVKLICRYGEVEKYKMVLHFRNDKRCLLGFFTMASLKAADAARKQLHGMSIGGHVWIAEKPPNARLMRSMQAKLMKDKVARPPPSSVKEKDQKCAKVGPRLNHADILYLAEHMQKLSLKENREVAGIISADVLAVTGISKPKVPVALEELSEDVVLKLFGYFRKRFGCGSGDSRPRMVSLPAISHGQSKEILKTPAVQSKAGKGRRHWYGSEGVIGDGERQKRQRAVTKWDLLRGLKCTVEEFLQIGSAMGDGQFRRFIDPSVMNAPNLPMAAYTTLRNDILGKNIGRLVDQIRDLDGQDDLDQPKTTRATCGDPVARRWQTLKRDFPDVATMMLKLQPDRDRIRAWVASSRCFPSSCLHIVAADAKSAGAVARALEDKDLHGLDDLAAFTRRLAQIDRDARFQLGRPQPGEINANEARSKELLEVGIELTGRYPGLSRLIGLETELPYHPSHEEEEFDRET